MIKNRRGNMPFAIIAVTILLMSTVAAAVLMEHSRSEMGVEEALDGNKALESSLDNVHSYVNQELGVIILDISRDDSLGNLDDRVTEFESRAQDWIEDRFPMRSGNVTIELHNCDIALTSVPMELVSEESAVGGYTPSYLHGKGKLGVTASSSHGSIEKDLTISTDGSYALPLAAEQGSLFERMVGGGGISVSQMMSYQLQTLAQTRVLNGYGATNQYGIKGTDSILTRQDVQDAYENSLKLIEAMCFNDGILDTDAETMDIARMVIGKEIRIDVGAFYGQILMSIMDDLVLKWFDYLYGNAIVDAFEDRLRPYKVALEAMFRFFNGDDPFSAEGYIERVMERNGIEPSTYRTPGSGVTTVELNGTRISVENPSYDIMESGWIHFFNVHYSGDRHYIEDSIRHILNSAAERIFEHSQTIVIELDPDNPDPFITRLTEALSHSPFDVDLEFETGIRMAMMEEKTYDPFYAAIADTVMKHAEEMADTEELRNRIVEAFTSLPDFDYDDIDGIAYSDAVENALHSYRSSVYRDLSVYEELRKVEGSGPGLIQESMSQVMSTGLIGFTVSDLLERRADSLLSEIAANAVMNPYSRSIDVPNQKGFQLMDPDGNVTRESLSYIGSNDPVISEPSLIRDKCTHVTGFIQDLDAAYTTTYSVRVDDDIDYRIECNSAYSEAMGDTFTGAMSGAMRNNIRLEIPIVSGWALCGVDYKATDTILDDAVRLVWTCVEPLLGPLREIMGIAMDTIELLNGCVMELSHYVSETLSRMFDRITGPLEPLAKLADAYVQQFLEDNMIEPFLRINLLEQRFGFEYMGYRFEVVMDLASLSATTKTIFVASMTGPFAGMDVEVSISLKCKGVLNANNIYVIGKVAVSSDDWKMKMSLDPLLRNGKHLATISADINGVDVTAVLPELEDYNEIGFTLSRIPGVGTMLQNIPLPIPGVKMGLDAGISIKYTSPTAKGLMINEFESNPPGADNGQEWVELLNNSAEEIDLTGYTLVAASDRTKKRIDLSGTISPGEYLIFNPTFTMVNESGKLTKKGEGLTLLDPEGVVIDKTGTCKDSNNDNRTWQRSYDGSSTWEFKEGTMGTSNGSYIASKYLTVDVAKDLLLDSLDDAFTKVDTIEDAESLQRVLEETVRSALDTVIKKISGCLIEASVFVKADIMDLSSSANTGIRVALRCDSDLVEDVLKYIVGNVESMIMSIKNPYRIDAVTMFTDNIDLEVTFDTAIHNPGILARTFEELPEADLGITFRTNISAMTRIFGEDTGKPEVECGIRFIDCPTSAIPSRLSPKSGMDHDLWLLKVNIEWK